MKLKNNKYLWMLAGGDMQILTAKIAKYKKIKLIITDKNKNAPCKKFSYKFFPIDITDFDKNLELRKKLGVNLSGIFTIASDCHLIVNKLAKKLNLHHTPIKISKLSNDKIKTRNFLKKKFIQPKSFLIKNYKHYLKLRKNLNSHYVIKHLNLSGSRGFKEFSKSQILSENNYNKIRYRIKKSNGILIEEKLQKDRDVIFSEMSAETVWQNGRIIFFNCVDRIFKRDLEKFKLLDKNMFRNVKNGYEIGHINPSIISEDKSEQILRMMKKLGKNLTYHRLKGCHILKIDIFFSSKGPVILEMTPRLSGGYDSTGSSHARGLKLSEAMMKISMGHCFKRSEIRRYFQPNKKRALVISRYAKGKRLFYMSSKYKSLKRNLVEINKKIKSNITIKNEQFKN